MDTHYEFSYVPASATLDGRFRKIEVKVRRANATVQSRNGYYALPLLQGQTLFPYELGALNALSATPPPRAFPLHVAALRFRSGDQATLFSLGYEVAGSDLKPTMDKAHKRFDLTVCFFSLIKDQHGEVVRKVSQEVPLTGTQADLESFTRGTLIATQPFILAPGRYTIESAVIAREQNVASTFRTSLVVPRRAGLDMSDLVLVNSLEQVGQESANQLDPLVTSMGKIRPELNPLIAVKPGTKMVLYFQVYASPAADTPQVEIEITRDGTAAGRLEPKPLPATANGVLPYFASLDVGQMSPGSYVAQVNVRQGAGAARQSLAFEVGDPSVQDARLNPAEARLAR